jgi:hypothetical protein
MVIVLFANVILQKTAEESFEFVQWTEMVTVDCMLLTHFPVVDRLPSQLGSTEIRWFRQLERMRRTWSVGVWTLHNTSTQSAHLPLPLSRTHAYLSLLFGGRLWSRMKGRMPPVPDYGNCENFAPDWQRPR